MSQSPEEALNENYYDIHGFIKKVKTELGIEGKIRVLWQKKGSRASSRMNGTPEISLPTVKTIIEETGMDKDKAQGKSKAQVLEELCHLRYTVGHNEELYSCVRRLVDKHLSEDERKLIEDKMERLRKACYEEEKKATEEKATEQPSP